jgi:hypothetical protein
VGIQQLYQDSMLDGKRPLAVSHQLKTVGLIADR